MIFIASSFFFHTIFISAGTRSCIFLLHHFSIFPFFFRAELYYRENILNEANSFGLQVFEQSINTNTHKSWLHKIYFRFLSHLSLSSQTYRRRSWKKKAQGRRTKKKKETKLYPKKFSLSGVLCVCHDIIIFTMPARSHLTAYGLIYYVTFWLNRFLANKQ